MALLSRILPSNLKYWNAYAPVLKVLQHSKLYQGMAGEVRDKLDLNPQDRVLEAGSGTGNWLIPTAPLVHSVVGVEFSPKMLAVARQRAEGLENVTFMQADLDGNLFLQPEGFTKAASVAVHGYLSNRQQLTAQVAEALAPGGLFAMATPRLGAKFLDVLRAEVRQRLGGEKSDRTWRSWARLPLGLLAAVFGVVAQLKARAGDFHFYAQPELELEFRRAGLDVVSSTITYANQYLLVVGRKPV